MFKQNLIKVLAPWLLLIFCLSGIALTRSYLKPFKSPSAYTYFVSPSRHLEHFTFGYRDLVADLLWLRVIQDLEVCDRKVTEDQLCSQSWVYRMVDKITDLSPQFRIVYATVPLLLAMSVNDPVGAINLFEKSLKYFPNDWPILYRGASLYLFYQGDKVAAADYLVRAQKNGAPQWLGSLAVRIYSEAGRAEFAERLVDEYKKMGFPQGMVERMNNYLLEAAKKEK